MVFLSSHLVLRILISPDEPCSSDTTTMYVNREACDVSRSYRQGYMYITVAGYTMSKFIITTSIVGEHIMNLRGSEGGCPKEKLRWRGFDGGVQ